MHFLLTHLILVICVSVAILFYLLLRSAVRVAGDEVASSVEPLWDSTCLACRDGDYTLQFMLIAQTGVSRKTPGRDTGLPREIIALSARTAKHRLSPARISKPLPPTAWASGIRGDKARHD